MKLYNVYTQVSQSTHVKHKTQNAEHILLQITQVLEMFIEYDRERYILYFINSQRWILKNIVASLPRQSRLWSPQI